MNTHSPNHIGSERVEIIPQPLNKFSKWVPCEGYETTTLINELKIPDKGKKALKSEAISILSRCAQPDASTEDITGLIVGYVQSGKTMSFTTITALACDNNYQIIIVIAGISEPLFKQSTNRLIKDLGLNKRPDRKWQHFPNPSLRGRADRTIFDILEDWKDGTVLQSEKQTILITVMKNHRHLNNLIQILSRLNLQHVPTLVIDDEADQAGLNTQVKKGEESTTYQKLLNIRKILPHHTFLQYTATPQAPLLINLIDLLSPDFAEVLTPGEDYTGGKEFFLENSRLVSVIPENEIPSKDNELTAPPDTLLYAMMIFFLGVASGMIMDEGKGNRSMLVHPSQKTMRHGQYFHWVSQIKERWKKTLEDEQDPDRKDLLDDFEKAYKDLELTVNDLLSFNELNQRLLHSIRRTRVEEVNAVRGKTPEINWTASYSYILVGGQAMDRGFTVEGLTVTYMPRGAGVGNADTVQQRARFFGYKKDYLGYCRVYLDSIVRDAYQHYVEHEEDIRKQLINYKENGKNLSEWKRAFYLNRIFKPTRDNVLDLDYMRGNICDEWYAPKAPHDSADAVKHNRQVVEKFLSKLNLQPDKGHNQRTRKQRHRINSDCTLEHVYEQLLTPLRMTRLYDSQRFTGLLIQMRNYIEKHPNETCAVYLLSRGQDLTETRDRKVNKKDEIPNLFQGAYPNKEGKVYPGDRYIRAPKGLSIHIQYLQVKDAEDKEVIASNVPAVCVWVPSNMSADWYVQEPSPSKG